MNRRRPPSLVEVRGAIVECCAARGDDNAHRSALLRDVANVPAELRLWFIGYFNNERDRVVSRIPGRRDD